MNQRILVFVVLCFVSTFARAQIATETIDVMNGETLTVSQEVLYDRITLREGSTLQIINDGSVTANTLVSLGTQENPVTITISKPATRDTMGPSFADEYAGIFLRRGSSMTFTNITADAQVAIVSHESLTMRDCTFVMPNQSQENYGQEQLAIVIQRIFTAERTTFGPCFASNWSERFSNGANTTQGSRFSLITLFGNVSTRPTRMTLRDCVFRDIFGDRGERGPNGTMGDPGEDAPDAILGNGITGDPGFPGNPGGTGDQGGSVTIINSEYSDRILVVNTVFDDIQGGDGGQGGNGGQGGVGGQGGDGADAVVGDGARGGRGGQGGQGGRQGNGGDGGDVVILRTSRHENPLVMTNVTMTSISSGRVGFDGLRGPGGPGGPGGAGGAGGAFGGETGDAGSPGSTGPAGDLATGGDEGASYAVYAESFFLSGDPVSSPEVMLSNSIISFADRETNTVLSAESFAGPLAAERLLVFRQTRVSEGNASSSDVITGNPLLANSGSGAASDYTPLPGSPAIDSGNNLLLTAGVDTDLVGNARFLDDPNTTNTGIGETPEDVYIVDLGAVEAPGDAPFCAPDIDGSGLLDFGDTSAFLTAFSSGDLRVDFDDSGALDFGDVSAFLTLFAAGCP